jgi:hypothetical protein
MRRVTAHITIQDVPLCQCEGFFSGLLNTLDVYCGYPSIAAANRAKKKIQRHRHSVKVVRGECPVVTYAQDLKQECPE